jgi:hypothetical protein
MKSAQTVREFVGRCRVEKPDHRHCGLLRPRRERPNGRRTAEERDERAPLNAGHGALSPLCVDPTVHGTVGFPTLSVPRRRMAGPWGTPEMF